MAAQVSDLSAWRPGIFVKAGEVLQWKSLAYKVLSDHRTPPLFNPWDSRLAIVIDGGGSGGSGRGVDSVDINEDNDLIISYTDGTLHNAGHLDIPPAVVLPTMEALTVNSGTLQPSATSQAIGTGPVVLYVNGVAYFSISSPAPFTVAGSQITWNEPGGLELAASDTLVVQYTAA
ncbi:hypothetical protein EVB87_278 [Rhizobium phage RHph_N28_1]|nr:hypothetical protein EVB87_278 [Rhizobium phage RHph_N28_1]QIG74306.1 hypothetical protein EVC07_278 [Rhizobium phage RHph_N42]QIG74915.1 hypothetical protein EVC12_280 [Rhizobium phage RHph_I42]QXV73965.1 hypothetical protein [Rhizobium phage RHph_N46]